MAVSAPGTRFAVLSSDRMVRVFSVATGKVVRTYDESLPVYQATQKVSRRGCSRRKYVLMCVLVCRILIIRCGWMPLTLVVALLRYAVLLLTYCYISHFIDVCVCCCGCVGTWFGCGRGGRRSDCARHTHIRREWTLSALSDYDWRQSSQYVHQCVGTCTGMWFIRNILLYLRCFYRFFHRKNINICRVELNRMYVHKRWDCIKAKLQENVVVLLLMLNQ